MEEWVSGRHDWFAQFDGTQDVARVLGLGFELRRALLDDTVLCHRARSHVLPVVHPLLLSVHCHNHIFCRLATSLTWYRWASRKKEYLGKPYRSSRKLFNAVHQSGPGADRLGFRTAAHHCRSGGQKQHRFRPDWCPLPRAQLPSPGVRSTVPAMLLDSHDRVDRRCLRRRVSDFFRRGP